ncbi:MAG: hypothetical protein C0506_01135 [Anaerolinea sp.]|nr:hypothetical protein [Anaerolinea sp.]
MGLVALVMSAAAAMSVSGALAQSPPNPPSRFAGTVKVNGQNAAPGTVVEARVGSASCGVTSVFMSGGEARYVLDSPEGNTQSAPGCGSDGALVTFLVGGVQAAESGPWRNYTLNLLNLSTSTATATPTPTKPATPSAPDAGTGPATEGGSGAPWLVISGLAVLAGAGAVGVRGGLRRR